MGITHTQEAAPPGGFSVRGASVRLLDSITEAVGGPAGCVVVSGSHGGLSAGRFALQAQVLLAVFNDAGVGKGGAGIAALDLMQAQGVAACTVAHSSARIGEAASTWHDGVLSHANAAASSLGAVPGTPLRAWLLTASASESSPARR